jgi:hypothetical protein
MSDTVTATSNQGTVPALTASNTAGGAAGIFDGSVTISGVLFANNSVAASSEAADRPALYGSNGLGGVGVEGISPKGTGVRGENGNGSGTTPGAAGCGVWGDSDFGFGVYAASITNDAIRASCASSHAAAVYGVNTVGGPGVVGRSTGNAGEFDGNVRVTGLLTAALVTVETALNTISLNVAAGLTASNIFAELITTGLVSSTTVATVNLTATGTVHAKSISTTDLNATGNLNVKGDIYLPGADCAEHFDIAADGEVEPGTVMVINADGLLEPSQQAYDTRVAGVISGAGKFRPGIILDSQDSDTGRMPIALVGKVYCKVDADYAAVEVGDLLTTSDTRGHARKAVDPGKAFGSVIGKALRRLEAGCGLIPVLIALQ